MRPWPIGSAALLLALLVVSCSKPDTKETRAALTPASDAQGAGPKSTIGASSNELSCKQQAFAESVDLAEASGATFLSDETLLLIGDSGTQGAFVVIDAKSGEPVRKGKLELDANASDDIEGVSHMDGKLYAITSSGWIREWSQEEGAFLLKRESYALAPLDSRNLVCKSGGAFNCAKNYEGLCLLNSAPAAGACAGFVAAKATGELICLVVDAKGMLTLDPSRSISVSSAGSLSGCAFDQSERLWFGNNFFAANAIGFVENWQIPEEAVVTSVGNIGLGFAEAIAAGPKGQLVRASDTSGSPSLLSAYICR